MRSVIQMTMAMECAPDVLQVVMNARTAALVLVAVSLTASGCKKDASTDTKATASASATTAASAAPVASAAKAPFKEPSDDSTPADGALLPVGKPAGAKTLFMFDPPQSAAAPKAIWSVAYAEKDDDRLVNLMEGDQGWMSLHFIDCRGDMAKKYVGKPLSDLGEIAYCFVTLPDTFKGFPSIGRDAKGAMDSARRVVRAGNVVVTSGAWERPKGGTKWKLADLDVVLNDMDWATIAKW